MSRPILLALALLTLGCQRDRATPHGAPAAPPTALAPAPPAPALGATAAPPSGWPTDSLFHATGRWQTQRGEEVSLAALSGAPSVLAMVFTSCQASCPVMMSDLKKLEAALPAADRPGVRFVVASFDSERDTPAALRAFAQQHRVDETRWTFLHGDEAAVRELAALLEVRYARLPQGGFDHANVITVLDAMGVSRHRQLGLGQPVDDSITRLRELVHRAEPAGRSAP